MNQTRHTILLTWLAACTLAAAEGTNTSSRTDYVSFRVIAERNIFNPNRSGRSSGQASTRREPERRVKSDRFALLGTMSYEKGRFAFFDGSSSEFKKVLKPSDIIAGFKVIDVAPTCVKLETTNGQTLELCVGMQMKKREAEDWELAGKADSADSAGTASSTNAPTASASGSEADDVLKRLMQRREQDGAVAATEAPGAPSETPTKPVEEKKDAASSGETDEVLKRLLQKREQELNK